MVRDRHGCRGGALARWLAGAWLALASLLASADPLTTLQGRMQLFRDGALRGFALDLPLLAL